MRRLRSLWVSRSCWVAGSQASGSPSATVASRTWPGWRSFSPFSSAHSIAGYETIDRFLHPRDVSHLWAVIGASIIGFIGNEGVAVFRLRVGREIGSAALIADGHHARIDGWTSLAVLFGAIGVSLGFPACGSHRRRGYHHRHPRHRLAIDDSGLPSRAGWRRAEISGRDQARRDACATGSRRHRRSRRWLGHRLHAEVNITVPSDLTVAEGHEIAAEVRHQLAASSQISVADGDPCRSRRTVGRTVPCHRGS